MAPADPSGVVQFDEGRADFPVDQELGLDQDDLSRFLLTHSMHLVTEYNSQVSGPQGHVQEQASGGARGVVGASPHESGLPPQTSPKIFAAKILNHLLLFINQTLAPHQELPAGFREAAPPFRGQVLVG